MGLDTRPERLRKRRGKHGGSRTGGKSSQKPGREGERVNTS
jgi:hypothetical protein